MADILEGSSSSSSNEKEGGGSSSGPKPSLQLKIGCPQCRNPDPDVVEGTYFHSFILIVM